MLAADSVAINRLQVKGDKRSSQALVRELEQTSWAKPLPPHLQQAWVLVRELHIKGKARELRQQTAQELDSQLQSAVRAIKGNAAAANVIWFASLPELIAFLLVDLALGKTAHWYWSRWAYLLKYPRQEAVARLLHEHCEHLPAIIVQLHSQQQLSLVWAQLSDASARVIVRELLRLWSLPSLDAWQAEIEKDHAEVPVIRQHLQSQLKLQPYWQPLLNSLPAKDGRVLLAAVIYGLTYTPLWLQHQPAALVQAFSSLVTRVSPQAEISLVPTKKVSHQDDDIQVQDKQETFNEEHKVDDISPVINTNADPVTASDIVFTRKNSAEKLTDIKMASDKTEAVKSFVNTEIHAREFSHQPDSQPPVTVTEKETGEPGNPEPQEQAADFTFLDGYEFITQSGGFFYLLNPLHRLLTQERMATQKDASVWHWLLDLYRVFAQQFPALEGIIDPPLLRFMLKQLQPEATATELQQLSLTLMAAPPCDFAKELFADLQQHFGETDFWKELETSPGFFATPARVIATASHWDIYFPLEFVRLDLRLAAWDINPGWLPWLGRVVNLHYVEQPLSGAGAVV